MTIRTISNVCPIQIGETLDIHWTNIGDNMEIGWINLKEMLRLPPLSISILAQ